MKPYSQGLIRQQVYGHVPLTHQFGDAALTRLGAPLRDLGDVGDDQATRPPPGHPRGTIQFPFNWTHIAVIAGLSHTNCMFRLHEGSMDSTNGAVQMTFLPPHSPDLNPAEFL